MMMKFVTTTAILLFWRALPVTCFDYSLDGADGLILTDSETGISELKTIFTDEDTAVSVDGIAWVANEDGDTTGSTVLLWETFVNGELQASGNVSLADVGRELPTSIEAGTIRVSDRERVDVSVKMTVDESTAEATGSYKAYGKGMSIIPLLVVLVFAASTRMVEFSLFSGIFVGACMVAGNLKGGFKNTLDVYLLGAAADEGHVYVILFTLFLSGLVGMMERSGGMMGFTQDVSIWATAARSGQFCCFAIGCFVFFDDYANVLLAGETMRPLLDTLFVSREKLAFIVDATAAPVASISPVSSWVGFEVGLIQTEIDRIIERAGTDDIGIKTSGLGVFLQSIKYRYYPIFMIVLMIALIYSKRDYGSMLIAERKTQVYKRTDGGDGKGVASEEDQKKNQPRSDTPAKSWNMIVPILLLIFFIFYLLVKTGDDGSGDQSVMDKIEASDSYSALLWGTMAAVVVTLIMYLLQLVQDGKLILPTKQVLKELVLPPKDDPVAAKKKTDDDEYNEVDDADTSSRPRFLMTVNDSVEALLHGLARIFPALIVLVLAWASGAVMVDVGADRLFSRWIVGGISPEALPTLSFLISFFMALATGTSWGTMTILFPLIMVPTYDSSGGDEEIFYAVTAGVLSGSVAGDHVSPISDTTVLSALACDCNLMAHVVTQAPYVLVIVIISMLLGTIPIGYDAWPNIIGILLGAALVVLFVYGMCVPVISPTGRYDYLTEVFLWWSQRRHRSSSLEEEDGEESPLIRLKEDTKAAYLEQRDGSQLPAAGGDGVGGDDADELMDYGKGTEYVEAGEAEEGPASALPSIKPLESGMQRDVSESSA